MNGSQITTFSISCLSPLHLGPCHLNASFYKSYSKRIFQYSAHGVLWWLLQGPFVVPEQLRATLGFRLLLGLLGQKHGLWAAHRLERWSRRPTACSTSRRFGWPAEDAGEWSWSSCCHGQRCPPTREFQPTDYFNWNINFPYPISDPVMCGNFGNSQ